MRVICARVLEVSREVMWYCDCELGFAVLQVKATGCEHGGCGEEMVLGAGCVAMVAGWCSGIEAARFVNWDCAEMVYGGDDDDLVWFVMDWVV
jgi:hypothetical protein